MRRFLHALPLLALLLATLPAHAIPAAAAALTAQALLGQTATATLWVSRGGQAASSALLYEANADAARPVADPAPLRVALPAERGPVSAALAAELASSPDGTAEMLIYLAEQADLAPAAAERDWGRRGAAVVAALTAQAQQSQAGLLAALRAQGAKPRSFWVVNAISVRGGRALASWVAAQPAVALVTTNHRHTLTLPTAAVSTTLTTTAWGVEKVNAPAVWRDWGVRGAGVVVANIDTGVAFTHTALLNTYRGWDGTTADHNYNWFDPSEHTQSPSDAYGHGTHTMGTMVGRATSTNGALGVAPDARWIAVRGCASFECSDKDLIDSAQWLLAPTDLNGDHPRPDLRPHIINNSWGGAGDWYHGYVAAWNAAGMFSVFANGNSGPGCGSVNSPGSYDNTFAVGATYDDDRVTFFSSRGPGAGGRPKPDVAAPGYNIPSAWPGNGVELLSGTSMATPHVAGIVALLWSANPLLVGDLIQTQKLLRVAARPQPTSECGADTTTVPNNVSGWGVAEAYGAVAAVHVDVPWLSLPPSVALPNDEPQPVTVVFDGRQVPAPGTYRAYILIWHGTTLESVPVSFEVQPTADAAQLHGRVVDHWTGAGVAGALRISGGPVIRSAATGAFTVTLPSGQYTATVSATGYVTAATTLAAPAQQPAQVVLLPDQPHLAVSAAPVSAHLPFGAAQRAPLTISNVGVRPLSVTVTIPPLEWSVVDSASGGPTAPLYDLQRLPAAAAL